MPPSPCPNLTIRGMTNSDDTTVVQRAAQTIGADPALLLDSSSFRTRLGEVDRRAADYADQVSALVAAAVEATPAYRTPAGQQAEQAPGPAAGGAVDDAALKALYANGQYDEILRLARGGSLEHLGCGRAVRGGAALSQRSTPALPSAWAAQGRLVRR